MYCDTLTSLLSKSECDRVYVRLISSVFVNEPLNSFLEIRGARSICCVSFLNLHTELLKVNTVHTLKREPASCCEPVFSWTQLLPCEGPQYPAAGQLPALSPAAAPPTSPESFSP